MENKSETKKPGTGAHGVPRKRDDDIRPAEYLRVVKAHLRNGKQKEAFVLLQEASIRFPDEPLILSYFGCLQAVVDKKYRSGVETCRKAIALFKKIESFDEELLLPVFYLNLGRAYLAAGKKTDAIDSFKKGLHHDGTNSDLLKEMRGMGMRNSPPLPFLDRSNPINKYIGLMLRKGTKEAEKNKGRR
jgi:tetratricopeptide (TPR) repeat protein